MPTKTISIMELAGSWGDIPEKEAEKIKEMLYKMRSGTRLKDLKKVI